MICKDCLPVFYTDDELRGIPFPDRPEFSSLANRSALILKHVELCPRHASEEAEAEERRRYALLEASATIEPFAATAEEAVRRAEHLLAEIERKEKTEAQR